jgi:hypothetical protein
LIELAFELRLALLDIIEHALQVRLVALQGLALFGQFLDLLVDLALLLGIVIETRPARFQRRCFVVQLVALLGQFGGLGVELLGTLVEFSGLAIKLVLALVELMTRGVQVIQLFFKPLRACFKFLLFSLKFVLALFQGLPLLIQCSLLVFELTAHGLAELLKRLFLLDLLLFEELAELGFAVLNRPLHAMQVILQGLPCPDDRRTILGGRGRV